MLATISHEQMNPLNSIINFTEYMKEKTEMYLCYDSEDLAQESDSSSFWSVSDSLADEDDIVPI